MTLDALTALAFAVQAQPGVYAVLIGSGVSRAADIPTGWGITNDLLRQLAATREETIDGEPAEWYHETFGEPVGFSILLNHIAPAVSDRQAVLARFIEPIEGEDHRRPTKAHQALARLAAAGYLRVFLTTNFDRLLEQALTDEGIHPLVVSNADMARGAAPFQHAGVVVFKLHGDYRDPDALLVTEDELAEYESDIAERLARTLEDYGLIACGWSGEWDPALRALIQAARSRRYPLYFAQPSKPAAEAEELIASRNGIFVPIDDADSFFEALESRVVALEKASQPHPLDITALVGQLRRLLPRDDKVIEVEDLLNAEANRAFEAITDPARFPATSDGLTNGADGLRYLANQATRYTAAVLPLAHAFATGCGWGRAIHDPVWRRTIERIANSAIDGAGQVALINLRRLPVLPVLYAGAIAAVHRDNYGALKAITRDAQVRRDGDHLPLIGAVHLWRPFYVELVPTILALEAESGEPLEDAVIEALRTGRQGKRHTPVSDYLHTVLREPLRPLIPDDVNYTEVFDRTEVLLALIAVDAKLQSEKGGAYLDGAWYGSFTWRDRYARQRLEQRIAAEARAAGVEWPPLGAGLFGADIDRLAASLDTMLNEAQQARDRRF